MSGKQRSEPGKTETHTDRGDPAPVRTAGMSLSMHDGVDASCDCCSCEAEPYWIDAMTERRDPADREG